MKKPKKGKDITHPDFWDDPNQKPLTMITVNDVLNGVWIPNPNKTNEEDKTFALYWSGIKKPEIIKGKDITNAFIRAGYTSSSTGRLVYYKQISEEEAAEIKRE